MLLENKYTAIAAVAGFLLMLWLTDGGMSAAFGVRGRGDTPSRAPLALALIAVPVHPLE